MKRILTIFLISMVANIGAQEMFVDTVVIDYPNREIFMPYVAKQIDGYAIETVRWEVCQKDTDVCETLNEGVYIHDENEYLISIHNLIKLEK